MLSYILALIVIWCPKLGLDCILSWVNCRESAAYQRTYSANDTTLNRLKSALVSEQKVSSCSDLTWYFGCTLPTWCTLHFSWLTSMCSWYIVRYRVPWYLVHITIIVLFQLVDLHVYLVPASSWQTGRNLATQVIVETLIFHPHFISIAKRCS